MSPDSTTTLSVSSVEDNNTKICIPGSRFTGSRIVEKEETQEINIHLVRSMDDIVEVSETE